MSWVACEDKNEGKMMEIVENKGLIDKKALENLFTTIFLVQNFVNSVLELSLYSLTLLYTQRILGALQHQRKERKGRTMKEKEIKDQARKSWINDYSQII